VASHGASATADELAHRHCDNPFSDDTNLRGIRPTPARTRIIEGQNLVADYLNPETQAEGVPGAIKELLRRRVDIIVAPYEGTVKSAIAASDTVPVVMTATRDRASLR
jgi:hypothetical protein